MPTWRDLRDPEWRRLLIWSRIYFTLVRLDRAVWRPLAAITAEFRRESANGTHPEHRS